MTNEQIIIDTAKSGLPALTELFNKLSKDDALKAIGILVVAGVGYKVIDAVVKIVSSK